MFKKYISLILIAIICSLALGCGYEMNAVVSTKNATVDYKFYLSSSEEKSLLADINKNSNTRYSTFSEFASKLGFIADGSKKINKKNHKCYKVSTSYDSSEYGNIFIHFDKKYATISADDVAQKLAQNYKSYIDIKNTKFDYCSFTIKYPYKVYKANGTIKKDGYTVSYNMSKKKKYDKRFWAVFDSKLSSNISIKGINKKTSYYRKNLKISISNVATSFKVNNVEQYSDSYTISKDGIYNIELININGKKTLKKVIIDKTKPNVTGVVSDAKYKKSVRIKFSDKTSGVKSAKLNNTVIKNNKIVSRKGKYTLKVTDYAGNVRTIKFSIG